GSRTQPHRRHHRRPCLPRAQPRRTGRHLRRDQSPRTGAAPRRTRAAAAGVLPVAAGGRAAVRTAGLRAAARAAPPTGASGMNPAALTPAFEALHFLRTQWHWALIALPLLTWARRRHLARATVCRGS